MSYADGFNACNRGKSDYGAIPLRWSSGQVLRRLLRIEKRMTLNRYCC